ncbi:hypothetical protein D9619_004924 [Psilocybe cf. subviscida]|uniref:Sodium/calcium exchanger membrane region domain-containing protein n=1 Tax=Psilocybe cf. subviscida TaxID=2480587 RepID=A0A8H5BPG4_9AGAR|nr:hypothetical protein D9619_004924 [Psilocybe cf. subviscida]
MCSHGRYNCATQLNSSLLTISVIALLLPAAFNFSTKAATDGNASTSDAAAILSLSHGVAIILLFIYAGYLFFQLYSHPDLYEDTGEHNIVSTKYKDGPKFYIPKKITKKIHLHHHLHNLESGSKQRVNDIEMASGSGIIDTSKPLVSSPKVQEGGQFEPLEMDPSDDEPVGESSARSNRVTGSFRRNRTVEFEGDPPLNRNDTIAESPEGSHSEKEAEEEPMLSMWMTIGLLVTVTIIVAVTAEFLVDSIDGLVEHSPISKEFVGIILLPIVGNAAEHVTAVTVSVKDKLNLSLGVAVGSSIQIALFVIPFIVTLAWILGKPLPLLFDPYESVVLFLSVLTVNYVVQDGKSNWLEGFILMGLYLILAVSFWYYEPVENMILALCIKPMA